MQKTFLLILLISLRLCAACQPAPAALPVTASLQPPTAAVVRSTFAPVHIPTDEFQSSSIQSAPPVFEKSNQELNLRETFQAALGADRDESHPYLD